MAPRPAPLLLLLLLASSCSCSSCPATGSWLPALLTDLLCSVLCSLSESSCWSLEELQISRLLPGEEEEALLFFHKAWSKELGLEAAEVAEVPEELVAAVAASRSLVVRHEGRMVAQLLGEVHRRREVEARDFTPPVLHADPTWSLFQKVWGPRPVDLAEERVMWPADLLDDYPDLDSVYDLGMMIVEEGWRRRGVAGALARRGEELAREEGCQGLVGIAGSQVTNRNVTIVYV